MKPRHMAWVLAGCVVIIYANSLSGVFHYDDFHSVVNNTSIREVGKIPAYFSEPAHFSADLDKIMYRPLLLVSYAVNYALHGYDVLGYHVVNLLLHLGCVLLLWRIVVCLEGPQRQQVAMMSALLFALHPVASEPVNYISSRSETLAGILLLLSLWLAVRTPRQTAGSIAGFCAGLLSKATAASLPFLLLSWPEGTLSARIRRVAPYAMALTGYVLLLELAGLLPTARSEPVRSGMAQLATQWKAVTYYLQLLLMPVNQSVDPPFLEGAWSQWAVWAALGLSLSLLGLVVSRCRGRLRWWLLWPLWLALPASAVPLNVLVNEHRIYLASAGLFVALAVLLARQTHLRRPMVALLVALAVLSFQRNQVWASELSLWSDAVLKAPQSSRGRVHLGTALREEGQMSKAREQFEMALLLDATLLPARINLANILYEQALGRRPVDTGLLRRAAAEYEAILQVDEAHREALTNLGNACRALGDLSQAEGVYQRAIRHHPQYPDAYDNLAMLYADQAEHLRAAELLVEVVRLEPSRGEAHKRLGDQYFQANDLLGALDAYRLACQLEPGEPSFCYNLGELCFHLSRQPYPQAQQYGEEAERVYGDLKRRHGAYRNTQQRLNQLTEGR